MDIYIKTKKDFYIFYNINSINENKKSDTEYTITFLNNTQTVKFSINKSILHEFYKCKYDDFIFRISTDIEVKSNTSDIEEYLDSISDELCDINLSIYETGDEECVVGQLKNIAAKTNYIG